MSREILQKLVKLANKQQKIIEILAQQASDPIIKLLTSIAEVATMNLNSAVHATSRVVKTDDPSSHAGSNGSTITSGANYLVSISGITDEKKKSQWKANFDNNVKQQSELQGINIAVIFN